MKARKALSLNMHPNTRKSFLRMRFEYAKEKRDEWVREARRLRDELKNDPVLKAAREAERQRKRDELAARDEAMMLALDAGERLVDVARRFGISTTTVRHRDIRWRRRQVA